MGSIIIDVLSVAFWLWLTSQVGVVVCMLARMRLAMHEEAARARRIGREWAA